MNGRIKSIDGVCHVRKIPLQDVNWECALIVEFRYLLCLSTARRFIYCLPMFSYYYYSSSNLRAHGVCDYDTLPIMRQDLSSYLMIYIYKYTRPYRMIFFCPVTVKLSNYLLRSRDSEY